MKNTKTILMFLVDDAIVQHDGCDVNIYDPGKASLHVYSADSPEWKNVFNYYLNTFPDIDDFFEEDEIRLLNDSGWSVLKVGFDKDSDQYVAMLYSQENEECLLYRVIWFDGSVDQFLIRSGQVHRFSNIPAEYFKRTLGI